MAGKKKMNPFAAKGGKPNPFAKPAGGPPMPPVGGGGGAPPFAKGGKVKTKSKSKGK